MADESMKEANAAMTSDSPRSDPYDVLGIRADASQGQIHKAWRKRTKAAGPGTPEFAAINDAAELLLDAERRASYDAEMVALQEAQATDAADLAADSDDEPPASDAGVSPETSQRRSLRQRVRKTFVGWNGTAAVAGILAVMAIVVAVWQGLDYTSASKAGGPGTGAVPAANFARPQADQQAALSAVKTGLPAVLSYSYDQMQADQANAERFLTPAARPGLAASYQRLINGGTVPGCKSALAPIATRKTVVAAAVVSAGIVSVSADAAQIGAFVNQTTAVAGQAAVTTQNRVLVNLKRVNGAWLIDTMSVPNTDHVLNC